MALHETQRQGPCPMHRDAFSSVSSVRAELWGGEASRAEEGRAVSQASGWTDGFLMRNFKSGKSGM